MWGYVQKIHKYAVSKEFMVGFEFPFRYAVPDIPYSIGASVTQDELNIFVNALLQESGDTKRSKPIDFEFIVLNEFLR